MGVWQDFKENLGSTRDVLRGDDVEVENHDTGETYSLGRRKLLISAGSAIAGWEGAKRTPGAAKAAAGGVASGADRAGDVVFGEEEDDVEIGLDVSDPSPNAAYEEEIPYDVSVEADGAAVIDMMLDGEEVFSQSIDEDRTFEGALTPDEDGTYAFGVGLSPQSKNPGNISDVSEHQEYSRFEVDFSHAESQDDSQEEKDKDNKEENLDYDRHDLPFSSIQEGLDLQSNDAYTAVEGAFAEAYFNRDNSVSETAEDAFVEVDDATAAEYLLADSDERDDMDVYLGFDDGNEGVKMRGSASAGVNEKFEEYMVGLEHLNRLDDEVEDYVQDLADSL